MAQNDILLTQNISPIDTEYSETFVNIGKGDLLSADVTGVPTVLSAGTDGDKLVRDDAEATGLKWVEDEAALLLDQTTPQTVTNGIPVFQGITFNPLYNHTDLEPTGSTFWDSANGTLATKLSSQVTLQHGRELYFYGKASGNIANGELCQYAGVQGDHILIKKCVAAEVIANPFILIGVATETFTNGNFGRTTWFGKINGVYTKTPANGDTQDWVAGDQLYFSNVTGGLTSTPPEAPEIRISVGYVIKAQTGSSENGIIEVAPLYGMRLQDLDDVDGTALTESGQIMVWDNTNKFFDANKNINDYIQNYNQEITLIKRLTAAEYAALNPKVDTTLYIIVG